MPECRIGCSGFSYNHWQEIFYPPGLPRRRWLEHYSSRFDTLELNVTFYRLVKPSTFTLWKEETPEGFSFSVKGSRYITHVKRLHDPREALERFFEGVLTLGEKLTAVLWQLPPSMESDPERLESFLSALRPYGQRHAFEFRHESWMGEEIFVICRSHRAALCSADWPPFLADPPLTADFAYIRRHGHSGSYDGRYSTEQLAADAERIRSTMHGGRDVLIYFNNDLHGYAPANADELKGMLAKSR